MYIGRTDRGGLSSGLTACVAAARRRTPHYNHLRTLEEEPLPPMLFSEAPVAVGPTLSPRDFFNEWKKKVEEKGGDKRERRERTSKLKASTCAVDDRFRPHDEQTVRHGKKCWEISRERKIRRLHHKAVTERITIHHSLPKWA